MIFLDANVFLRFLVRPTPGDPNGAAHHAVAAGLFTAIEQGGEQATTTEVVLHEVWYVLASKKHYHLPPADIAAYLAPILRLPGFRLPRGEKRLYLQALEIAVAYPRLEFADAVVAARCERLDVPLATFDEQLAKLPMITRWQPPSWG